MKIFTRLRLFVPISTFGDADDGLLDSELASEDPIGAWLARYLTPVER